MSTIALAAATKYTAGGESGPWYDNQGLKEALEVRGHRAEIISWQDLTIDLLGFDAIFVSSTWDGCADPPAFSAWLDRCERDGRRRLINSRALLDAGFTKCGAEPRL